MTRVSAITIILACVGPAKFPGLAESSEHPSGGLELAVQAAPYSSSFGESSGFICWGGGRGLGRNQAAGREGSSAGSLPRSGKGTRGKAERSETCLRD